MEFELESLENVIWKVGKLILIYENLNFDGGNLEKNGFEIAIFRKGILS